ncbi:gamma-glutamyl-gamma-aminobutyrate hydrolase family protein [Pseudonocardia sp. ICBG1293]|uniref:gamma-glutamyl-gamma-aminobutyrate hydrolase family protein n=1 Tax=Pseudonocardia sp. ICBG1293 TaxID=2844382 RepID=UPI001CCAE2CA|nr:gamma-glutamyl-gamma-aminobutyrate hydrolase family protein [Pseudonocardia sp. ICBG1293]
MRPPLIGISCYAERADYWIMRDDDVVLVPRSYVDMVLAAGGVPVLLAPVDGAAGAVDALDGLLVTGGPDVDPARYGHEPGAHTDPPRTERDAADLAALHRALGRGIPVLGVCRGHQLLNVALGGTLHQHLPDVVGREVAAAHAAGPGVYAPVPVRTEPGTRAAQILGPGPVTVRCHHHQGVDRVAPGLRVSARAGAVVEALEWADPDGGPDEPWVLGVQSHPERDAADLRLARALVAAAGRARDRVVRPDRVAG